VNTVLSNSFGFGGNNAAVVIGRGGLSRGGKVDPGSPPLRIGGWAGLSGAGHMAATLQRIDQGLPSLGRVPEKVLDVGSAGIDTRRLKRLPRMALVLAAEARRHSGSPDGPQAVFCGTGWGALSETWDFLARLQATRERFASPTDFIGSVHNAAAGCVALEHQARGANVTTTGGDHSFEQSLLAAQLTAPDGSPSLLLAVDEAHARLTPLIDPAAGRRFEALSDGGGALWIDRAARPSSPWIRLRFFGRAFDNREAVDAAVRELGAAAVRERYGLILAGIPAGRRPRGIRQLRRFQDRTAYHGPVVDYRPLLGEYPSVSALAATLAAAWVSRSEEAPAGIPVPQGSLGGKGVLLMGLGDFITATEIMPA
jgi:3-oxoacyl-[acyl-carrier-protein] synthase-1/3-oxoacyl-[acyl-carrier-protein] synthase II